MNQPSPPTPLPKGEGSQSAVPLPAQPRRWWVRLVHTPLADLMRLRLSGRLDVKAAIAEAEVPEPVRQVVRRVVRKTRLWRCEKVDVAHELIDHFGDGLAAGQSPDELIEAFGDPRQAARLIRRAKRRNRPLFWRAWSRAIQAAGWTLAALVVVYVGLFVRFVRGKPNIAWNYMAELNAEAKAVPEEDRAWPLYREALLKLEPVPEGIKSKDTGRYPLSLRNFFNTTPDEADQWTALSTYVAHNQESVGLARRAAARPRLGFWYGNPADTVPFPASEKREPLISPPPSENPPIITLDSRHIEHLRLLSSLLWADARLAASERDGAKAAADLAAMIGICRHCYDAGRYVYCNLLGLSSFGLALETLHRIVAEKPDTFSDAELLDLAHEIAAVGNGGPLRIQFEGERAFFRDLLQRIYTDDGTGGGRLTSEGMRKLPDLLGFGWHIEEDQPWLSRVGFEFVGSAASVALANRREMSDLADRLFDEGELEARKPMWQWGESQFKKDLRALESSPIQKSRFAPIVVFMPTIFSACEVAEQVMQERDAALVAIALELYRRRHGRWPERLEQLVPDLLPSVPPDRFDGQPLRYKVTDGLPVVYSVGADRVDDGGVPNRTNATMIWSPPSDADDIRNDPFRRGD